MLGLQRLARQYHKLSHLISAADRKRKTLRDEIMAGLEKADQQQVTWETKSGARLRAQRIPHRGVSWDVKRLVRFLKKKGLTNCLKISVDEDALEAAIQAGTVTLEDLHKYGTPTLTWSFRVDYMKPRGE